MAASDWTDRAVRLMHSAPNWCGLGLASVPLLMKGAGLLGGAAFGMALGGYLAGFVVGGLWFGFPQLGHRAWEADLLIVDQGDARQVIERSLRVIRTLLQRNPEGRLSDDLQQRVEGLCGQMESLLVQWEQGRGALSLEDEFHARHIARSYLPEALRSYLSIPADFARRRLLDNGRTAHDTLIATLDDLGAKLTQLSDDLASQDAQAFLSHSRFLGDKFGSKSLPPH